MKFFVSYICGIISGLSIMIGFIDNNIFIPIIISFVCFCIGYLFSIYWHNKKKKEYYDRFK